jgi:hypothetical protein
MTINQMKILSLPSQQPSMRHHAPITKLYNNNNTHRLIWLSANLMICVHLPIIIRRRVEEGIEKRPPKAKGEKQQARV